MDSMYTLVGSTRTFEGRRYILYTYIPTYMYMHVHHACNPHHFQAKTGDIIDRAAAAVIAQQKTRTLAGPPPIGYLG